MHPAYFNFFTINRDIIRNIVLLTLSWKWHTINSGLALLAWPGLKVGLASFLAPKLAQKKFLAWLQNLDWPQIWSFKQCFGSILFFQTDIFLNFLSMFFLWFYLISIFSIKKTSISYFLRLELHSKLPTIWFLWSISKKKTINLFYFTKSYITGTKKWMLSNFKW